MKASIPRSGPGSTWPGLLAGWLGASVWLSACRVPIADHCLHLDLDPHAYCAAQDPARPFCSPCEGTHHGCVAEEPTLEQCPAYEPWARHASDLASTVDTDSSSESTGSEGNRAAPTDSDPSA